jgi:hypothetical protein
LFESTTKKAKLGIGPEKIGMGKQKNTVCLNFSSPITESNVKKQSKITAKHNLTIEAPLHGVR